MIPFADCINHHNVDSTYEFICKELHEPLFELDNLELTDRYSIDINTFIEDNKKQLQLDNPDSHDMEDATYYTKSKMMFDISDFYIKQSSDDSKVPNSLKWNSNLFQNDDMNDKETEK